MTNGDPTPKVVGSDFKLVVIIVFIFILITFFSSFYISSQGEVSQIQQQFFGYCNDAWKAGIGLFFGLLGGKAL